MSKTDIVEAARVLCPVDQEILELRAHGVPRWFVPMGNLQTRYSSLDIRPSTSWKGRAYRAALRTWITLGAGRLTHHVIPKRKGGWTLGELLSPDFPTLSTAAVSIGVPGPHQKITVQLMDNQGHILGFAKYAETVRARALVANEARMLGLIPKNTGPRLVRFAQFHRGELLVQTPLPGRARMPRSWPVEAHIGLIERLIRPGEVQAVSEHPFVKGLYTRAGQRRSMLERIITDLEDSEWPVALHHGDLSPWNMRWQSRNKCQAFDWEYGREEGLAYLEAAHAPIQVGGLVRKTDPLRAKRAVSEYVRCCLPARLSRFAPAMAALSALNILISWYPPREPDAYEQWLTTFAEV